LVFTASLLDSALTRNSEKIGRQVRLLCPRAKALNEIASTFGKTGSNRWQLDSKTAKVTSLSPGPGTWQINEQNCQQYCVDLMRWLIRDLKLF